MKSTVHTLWRCPSLLLQSSLPLCWAQWDRLHYCSLFSTLRNSPAMALYGRVDSPIPELGLGHETSFGQWWVHGSDVGRPWNKWTGTASCALDAPGKACAPGSYLSKESEGKCAVDLNLTHSLEPSLYKQWPEAQPFQNIPELWATVNTHNYKPLKKKKNYTPLTFVLPSQHYCTESWLLYSDLKFSFWFLQYSCCSFCLKPFCL